MNRALAILALAAGMAHAQPAGDEWWTQLKRTIQTHLGRPYVWGSCGVKSFDCSGFVWRVYFDSGVIMKRTTARKLYYCLPEPGGKEDWAPGNVVFFDDLRHCGIVNSPTDFFHAGSTTGTARTKFEPYWRPKVVGVRRIAPP